MPKDMAPRASNARTRALLAEHHSPTHTSRADVADALVAFFEVLERAGAQALRGRSLLNLARVAEQDPAVAGKFEELQQSYGAMQRIAGEMERLGGDLLRSFEQAERVGGELRSVVIGSGYTL